MKTILTILAFILSSLLSLAQPGVVSQGSPSEMLDENYVIHLEMARQGAKSLDLKLVTAKRTFQVDLGKPSLSFSGTLTVQKDGNVYLGYFLARTEQYETINDGKKTSQQFRTGWNSGVQLKLGKSVTILENGNEVFRLSVAAEFEGVQGVSPRDRTTKPRQIDLSKYYNGSLHQGWLPATENGTTAQKNLPMPLGVGVFDGVEFDVRGLIQLSGEAIKKYGGDFPEKVVGIKVGEKCKRLHFLHAAGWANYADDGVQIGIYVLHYGDGLEREIPIINGDNVGDWGVGSQESFKRATVAWHGENETMSIRVFKTTWENPLPDQVLQSIDYVSKMTIASPFLLAITAE